MSLLATSSQTSGPYVHIGFERLLRDNIAAPGVEGERVAVSGHIVDGEGRPMNDGFVEIWQADARGRYAHPESGGTEPEFRGFGRVATDAEGRFAFTTVKPGRVPGPQGSEQAPHLTVLIFSRGLLRHLWTRMYFPDDANAEDPILALVPPDRRATLVARSVGPSALEWNIVLQGADETVFFDL